MEGEDWVSVGYSDIAGSTLRARRHPPTVFPPLSCVLTRSCFPCRVASRSWRPRRFALALLTWSRPASSLSSLSSAAAKLLLRRRFRRHRGIPAQFTLHLASPLPYTFARPTSVLSSHRSLLDVVVFLLGIQSAALNHLTMASSLRCISLHPLFCFGFHAFP